MRATTPAVLIPLDLIAIFITSVKMMMVIIIIIIIRPTGTDVYHRPAYAHVVFHHVSGSEARCAPVFVSHRERGLLQI
jgi:hypothetical protein